MLTRVFQLLALSADAEYKPRLRTILPATHAIMFFGTPHRGSDWTGFLKRITILAAGKREDRILQTLTVNSESLENLMDRFANMLKGNKFNVHTFLEGRAITDIPGLNSKVGLFTQYLKSLSNTALDCGRGFCRYWRRCRRAIYS
jgi:hypothetical protein